MKILLKRLREPSTWAGVAGIAVLFGVAPETVGLLEQVVGGAAGLAAIVLPELTKGE